MAGRVDTLYLTLVGIATFFSLLIAGLIVYYFVKYRRRAPDEVGARITGGMTLEVTWTVIPLLITMVLFVWGSRVYVAMARPPDEAENIYVVGKQWMWKFQHLDGQREIDELHVPVGQDVRLVMASQDVIHSFFVPALRIKQDVVPGRYETMWFRPDKVGRYHLFCSEYCGTDHAHMGGWIYVMNPRDFADWLQAQGGQQTLAAQGEQLFRSYGCSGCHEPGGTVRAPRLEGLFGSPVPLSDGTVVTADERYVRDSILDPQAQVAAGYQPVMPTFAGQISEDDLAKLVAYIESIGPRKNGGR
jgi:cytochrome c oxidase subunit 2